MSRGHEIYIKYSLHKLLCYGFHRTVERIKIFIVFSVENAWESAYKIKYFAISDGHSYFYSAFIWKVTLKVKAFILYFCTV